MSDIKIEVSDMVPEGTFVTVPWTPELEDHAACGRPTTFTTQEWKGKKVVLVAVPGAFTPTCHVNHIPPFLQKYDQLKAKGIDVVAVTSANDAFVLSGWARFLGLQDKIITISDPNARWSKQLGLDQDLSARDMGIRTQRYALILDDLKVTYVGVDTKPGVLEASGVDAILAAL